MEILIDFKKKFLIYCYNAIAFERGCVTFA